MPKPFQLPSGTIVYEGSLDGRPVAVKRLLRQFYDLARKEIEVGACAWHCAGLPWSHCQERKVVVGLLWLLLALPGTGGGLGWWAVLLAQYRQIVHAATAQPTRPPPYPRLPEQVLIVSDEHPNVVRCFAMEEDREFVYLALERCRAPLSDALAVSWLPRVCCGTGGREVAAQWSR